ncbi:hypothetical protein AcV7_005662 [Taiwanofungus camphoratus]|nr:hypothetical protein AcV7_005662 [Antrodia cinnamomea]
MSGSTKSKHRTNLAHRFQFFRKADKGNSTASSSESASPTSSALSYEMVDQVNNIADSEYARKRRELFKLVKDLRAMGADSIIGVPRLAVIGAQSAGKSSLVEAVTGINVPRDSGTCTRCPMECSIMTSSDPWTCQISLRLIKPDPHGNNSSEQSKETPFSPLLSSKGDVEIWLRRAQAAILSPHKPQESFRTMHYQELRDLIKSDTNMLKFSRNVVVVDIQDPDGTDLSFVDLPGLIQNAEPDMINLVASLVETYVGDESTLILVTIPANDDLENQQAMRIARTADPEGGRTIGVVTKPDSLTQGASGKRQMWLDIFHGKIHKLHHGYYVVRLPDDEERKKRRREMEFLAMEFLSTTRPWTELMSSQRLGIPNFISSISKLLMRIIEESLPKLREEVQARLCECAHELEKLPKKVTVDPSTEILGRVFAFCNDVKDEVYGKEEDKTFVHRNRAVYKTFKIAIRRTAPDFRPFENTSQYGRPRDLVLKHDDSDEEAETDTGTDFMDLYDVRRVIQESIAWELPNNLPYEAKRRLIKSFIEDWPTPTKECFNKIIVILSSMVNAKISKHFGQFRPLEQYVGPLIRTEMGRLASRSLESVDEIVRTEREPYFTQNDHYLEYLQSRWLRHYRIVKRYPWAYIRRLDTVHPHSCLDSAPPSPESVQDISTAPRLMADSAESRALRALAELGYNQLAPEDLERLHPPDRFAPELEVMADVRAYFHVAYKRIIDQVPMTIQHTLNQGLANAMQEYLLEELKLGTPDASQRFVELLAEDPVIAAQRKELEERMKRLTEIQERLIHFTV